MRRVLSLFSILALAVAGSVMAQTGYDTTDPPSSVAEGSQPSTTVVDPPVQQGASTTGSMSGSSSMSETAEAETPAAHESLPATASNWPLVLMVGAAALAAAAVVRAYRLRREH